jgi:hypothetical protein
MKNNTNNNNEEMKKKKNFMKYIIRCEIVDTKDFEFCNNHHKEFHPY